MGKAAAQTGKRIATVLVVDDEESAREIIASTLLSVGFQVRQAVNGAAALTILNAVGEFDLLLADILMPEMDGIALLEQAHEKYPDMQVIMVTGVHDISVALAAIRNGACDCLLKPFEREQLLAIVRRAVEHRRLKLEERAYRANLEAAVAQRTEQLRKTMNDLERSYDITLEALGDAMALRNAETATHSRCVMAFTVAITRAMGKPTEDIRIFARAAFLHEIGKFAVPETILHKAAALTSEESAVLRNHCLSGYQMLHKIPFFKDAAEIVYAHEEHYDGNGYPRGLRGEQIPMGARIVAVACALDRMVYGRPAQGAQAIVSPRKILAGLSGRQFDPAVVDTLLLMPEKVFDDLRREIVLAAQGKKTEQAQRQ